MEVLVFTFFLFLKPQDVYSFNSDNCMNAFDKGRFCNDKHACYLNGSMLGGCISIRHIF